MKRNGVDERVKLLFDIKEVFDKNDIFFFPIWGTLLGFIRDKKLIDYDDDLDIACWVKDWEKVENTFKEFSNKGYGTQYKFANTKHSRLRIFVKLNKDEELIGLKKPLDNICGFTTGIYFFDIDTDSNEIFLVEKKPYRTRFPNKGFKKMKIYDKYFNVPTNSIEFCKLIYGDNWKVPIKNWKHPRICDHHGYKKKWIFRFVEDRWRDITNWRQVGLKKVFKFW